MEREKVSLEDDRGILGHIAPWFRRVLDESYFDHDRLVTIDIKNLRLGGLADDFSSSKPFRRHTDC
jgi:hypothetical protein